MTVAADIRCCTTLTACTVHGVHELKVRELRAGCRAARCYAVST